MRSVSRDDDNKDIYYFGGATPGILCIESQRLGIIIILNYTPANILLSIIIAPQRCSDLASLKWIFDYLTPSTIHIIILIGKNSNIFPNTIISIIMEVQTESRVYFLIRIVLVYWTIC